MCVRAKGFAVSLMVSSAALALVAGPAMAQVAEPIAANGEGVDNDQQEEVAVDENTIVVTGRFQDSLIDRLPIKPRELPFTLDTISREDIDKRNFVRRIDILDTLPNVQLGQEFAGGPNFRVRGFTAPVLVNNRVVNVFRNAGIRDDTFVERYEVLKGPASIALGPIAGGGVINTVTKQPKIGDFTDIRLTSDQFGTVNAEFDLNDGELFGSDVFGFRASGAYRDFSFDAEEITRQEFAIRGVVGANPSSKTSVRLSVAYMDIEGSPGENFPLFDDGSVPPNFDTDTFFGVQNGFQDVQDLFIEGQIAHDFLDNLQLTLRGSHQSSDQQYLDRNGIYNYLQDNGGPGASTDNPIGYAYSVANDLENDTDFIDAQLLYTFDVGGLDQSIVVGSSYVKTKLVSRQNFIGRLGPFRFDEIDEPRFGNPEGLPAAEPVLETNTDLLSFYGELALRPLENLTIVGGIRYDDFRDETERFGTISLGFDDDEVTWRLGASYEITPDLSVFVSYAQAFQPQIGIRRDGSPVGAENSENFEVGLKGRFLDGLVDLDLAAFSTTRSNVSVRDPANIIGDITFFLAIGEQRNRGFEASLNLDTGTGFDLDLSYGHLDQDLLENLEGGLLVSVPDHQVSAFGTYTIQDGPVSGLEFGGGFRYFSSRISQLPTFRFPDVTVFDAYVRYPLTDNTAVSLNVINAGDNLYLESGGGDNGTLGGQQTFGPPRTFIFSLRTRY
ncbi:MAG: TonB-dependent receptor [Pseudomonadota bacterium]